MNPLHPDAVFDTGVWTQEALERSAKRYGMTVEAYKSRNLLGAEITSHRKRCLGLRQWHAALYDWPTNSSRRWR
ncbi:hypothetical protein [Yoonia maricola]|uniref:hypothetical protein n=1 Tax=Yoonia maricola TaxID=420999 RepID=UPI001B3B3310|nr:hypothetical protein [Yoonia maricola]